ncbi:MAG TPA: sodium:proton exchanger [Lachnospiraceae bacterium]|nr:sodium:proton exchanger [Lachnospiraceae bacterium]
MFIPVLLFALGLILLIKGGDWFVDGAAGIASSFKVPDLLIGATVVSIGTTLPEVMVSANSALSDHGEIAYGNAVGSIICNTALIAAVTIAIKPSVVDRRALITPVIFFFTAATFYTIIAAVYKGFSRITGVILLAMFACYMVTLIKDAMAGIRAGNKKGAGKNITDADKNGEESIRKSGSGSDNATDKAEDDRNPIWKLCILLVIGAVLIATGADLLVDNGTLIAQELGVPESVIALTFVALGTSLPELVTAITSLIKGHGALSLGNICGANLFNLVLVSGLSIVLRPFQIPAEKVVYINGREVIASLVIDIPIMILVMLIMTVPALIRGRLSRAQGIILLVIYFTFAFIQFFG